MTAAATPPDSSRVGVVILNYNGWADTLECLESVFRVQTPALHVVVCDNDSSDGSVERILQWAHGDLDVVPPRDERLAALSHPPLPKPIANVLLEGREPAPPDPLPPLTLIAAGENRGFAAGNNAAVAMLLRAGVDFIWILNNDAVVAADAVAPMLEQMEDPRMGIVGARVLHYEKPDLIQAAGGGEVRRWTGLSAHRGRDEPDRGQWDAAAAPQYVTGCTLLARAQMVREIGPLDEAFFVYSEEVDWCFRAVAAGWKLGYAGGSRVWHREGATTGKGSAFSDYHSLRGVLLLTRRHAPARLPLVLAHSIFRFLLPKVVRLQPERLRATLAAYRDFFRGASGTVGRPAPPGPLP